MAKEKVTVVVQPGQKPVVFTGDSNKARQAGAATVHKRAGSLDSEDKESLGKFVEGQNDSGRVGSTEVHEVEVQD